MIGASPTTRAPRGAGRRAFTAMELLVATLVLGMMVTMAAMMLASSRKLVSGAQAKMRANSIAAAIADLIRRDIHRAGKAGFLHITPAAPPLTSAKLVLAIPGNAMSVDSNTQGDGEVICYGLAPNAAGGDQILFRTRWVLKKSDEGGGGGGGGGGSRGGVDVWGNDNWGDIVNDANGANVAAKAQEFITGSPTHQLSIPPGDVGDILNLWQAVAAHCSELTLWWTDGPASGTANKYLHWQKPEEPDDSRTWTYLNPNDWPKAIRVKFKMIDPSMPPDFRNVYYEVVCPLGL